MNKFTQEIPNFEKQVFLKCCPKNEVIFLGKDILELYITFSIYSG